MKSSKANTQTPDTIFGLRPTQHRVNIMKLFLEDRSENRGGSGKRKDDLLKAVSKIERSMFEEERLETTEWFVACEEADRLGQKLPTLAHQTHKDTLLLSEDWDAFEIQPQHTRKRIRSEHEELETGLLVPNRPADDSHFQAQSQPYEKKPKLNFKLRTQRRFGDEYQGGFEPQIGKKIKDSMKSRASTQEDFGKECSVCMDRLGANQFPRKSLTDSCIHHSNVCKTCITTSINAQIPDVFWDRIRCPECPSTLPYEVVKKYASAEAFTIFDRKSLLAAFGAVPNFAMCLNPACTYGQIHESGAEQPIMTCDMCGFRICFVHKTTWYEGKTCAEYEEERGELNAQIKASETWIEKSAKICPNPKCGIPITKRSGCDHMTCQSCNHQFCYVCRAPWREIMREGNTAHEPDCKYHTSNLSRLRINPAVRRQERDSTQVSSNQEAEPLNEEQVPLEDAQDSAVLRSTQSFTQASHDVPSRHRYLFPVSRDSFRPVNSPDPASLWRHTRPNPETPRRKPTGRESPEIVDLDSPPRVPAIRRRDVQRDPFESPTPQRPNSTRTFFEPFFEDISYNQ